MSDLYLAEDGTIRSRSGRAEPYSVGLVSPETRTARAVPISTEISLGRKCLYWIASLVVTAVIALISCSLFSSNIVASSGSLSPNYVNVLIFIGAYVGNIIHAAVQSDYSGLDFFLGLLCTAVGILSGAILALFTPILFSLFFISAIIVGCLNAD